MQDIGEIAYAGGVSGITLVEPGACFESSSKQRFSIAKSPFIGSLQASDANFTPRLRLSGIRNKNARQQNNPLQTLSTVKPTPHQSIDPLRS